MQEKPEHPKGNFKSGGDCLYGILKTTPLNIGEEIQIIAAKRFLPRVDVHCHREKLNSFKSDKKTKLIMNGWYMHNPKHFPPSPDIDPLLISMHFSPGRVDKMLSSGSGKGKKYLLKNGPVGARDLFTLNKLREKNIPSYFSGCLTLTLEKNEKIKKRDFILCVDLPQNLFEEIKQRTKRPVYNIPTNYGANFDSKQRFEIANIYLKLIQEAACVVSRRLHAILPAIALETPAVLLYDPKYNTVAERFSGFEDIVTYQYGIDEFLNNKNIFDFESPPPNSENYIQMKNNLIEKCAQFTGFDNCASFIDENSSYINLLNTMEYREDTALRSTYRLRILVLFKILIQKLLQKFFNRKIKYDID